MCEQKILLIAMPWARVDVPSIQLGILSAYLLRENIAVDCRYYYLKLADMLGVNTYRLLSAGPFDASVIYSDLLFEKKEYTHHKFLSEEKSFLKKTKIDCELLLKKLRHFHQEIVEELEKEIEQYDIIGFTIGYAQEIPSLCLARALKKRHPEKLIVFGGSCCYGELGTSLIRNFDYIDVVISGEGEEALLELVKRVRARQSLAGLPGSIYREQGEIIENPARPLFNDLDQLPYPVYDSYFQQYTSYPRLAEYNPYTVVTLPIESSRGCWWNRCAFCGLNRQFIDPATHRSYRTKSIPRILEEIQFLGQNYPARSFQFMDNVQFQTDELCKALLTKGLDFTYFTESRASITPESAYYFSETGFTSIQIGIESFSYNILRKMCKGITVLENVNALKWCKFFNIKPYYNIMTHFPLETSGDVQEETALIKKIIHLDPPSGTPPFMLCYNSPVYQNPTAYNVCNPTIPERYKYIYPKEILDNLLISNLSYETITPLHTEKAREHFFRQIKAWRENRIASLLYYDFGDFLKIVDMRHGEQDIYILEGLERQLYLFLNFIRTGEEISEFCARHTSPSITLLHSLPETLVALEENGLLIAENDKYLGLALPGTPTGRRKLLREIGF